MARNGSGTMTIPNTLVSGTTITASDHNENYSDIATEITNSVAADGQTTMSGQFKASSGTAAAPGIAFGSDTDTGVYRIGANNLGVAVNGANVLDVSTTGMAVTGTLSASGTFTATGNLSTGGNASVTGTLGVTGAATLSSTLAVTGNVAVNTDKFTVAASTGNTAVGGTLAVTGAATLSSSISAASVGGSMVAAQADQETGSSTTTVVTPGRQHHHKSAAKAWVRCNFATPSVVQDSYGVTSVTNNGTGDLTVNLSTAFSNANFVSVPVVQGSGAFIVNLESKTTTTARFVVRNAAGSAVNGDFMEVAFFGDQ